MAAPLPALDVPVLNAAGKMNQVWFDYFKSLQSVVTGLLDPPSPPSFTVSELTPGSTAFTPTAGVAKTMTASGATPVIQTFLFYASSGLTAQNMFDNFGTIADALTKAATNITNIQTAVSALNTRVTALENKENDVISDLTTRFP